MERASGASLDTVIDSMSNDSDLQTIATELSSALTHMSSLKHPHNKVGSVANDPFRNALVCCAACFSPKRMFDSVGNFHDYWRDVFLLTGSLLELYVNPFISQFPRNCGVHFTHMDLVPRNIIVDGTKITGIRD
ncbi:hypothetical protein K435DRAFT_932915 [Dendrothele bispora CBS 962.96]|uniref:Protein kinase domain-containing protein n=1 Tax=Dendrothele bispora (strain CBS 962.96) TaxID=1314807 RepID=A0A4V4HCC7_DENBC|nr:hypothetical protein K435DRAFT_932915 [Dendrothele bispora CBS 962.96]